MPTESPCVRHCCLDGADVCLGCGRLLQEILQWHQASDAERELICERAKQRLLARQASSVARQAQGHRSD